MERRRWEKIGVTERRKGGTERKVVDGEVEENIGGTARKSGGVWKVNADERRLREQSGSWISEEGDWQNRENG